MLNRRGLITGLVSLVAAPAIIRVNHLMPISVEEYRMPFIDMHNPWGRENEGDMRFKRLGVTWYKQNVDGVWVYSRHIITWDEALHLT